MYHQNPSMRQQQGLVSYGHDKQGSPLPPLAGAGDSWASRSQARQAAKEHGSWTAHPNIHNKSIRNRSGSHAQRSTSTQRGLVQNKRPPTSDGTMVQHHNGNTSYVPGRGQVARPSTTPNPSNRGQLQNHLSVHGQGSSPHPEDEGAANPEVLMLKDEVRRLQNALLERFRGNSKFVSGGQFRAAQSRQTNDPEKCMQCSGMRVQVKRVKGECRDLRAHCDEVEKKMTDAHNQKKMIELQMQHAQQQHTQSMQQMMGQLQAAREGEAAQAQIVDRLRAELEKLRNQKNVVQENKEDEALRRQRDDLERRLAHSQAAANRAKELEIELKKLRIYVRDIESKHKRTEVQLKEEQAATGMARTQLRVAEDRVAQLEQERSAMEERIADLKKQNSGQVREIEVIKTKLVKEESEKVQLVLKLGKLKGQIGNLEVQAKNAKGEAEAARRDLMSLQQKYDDLMRKHKSQEGKIEDYEEELARLRREMEALQKEVDRLRAEVEALKAQLAKRDEEDGGKVPQHELDKLEAQLKRALKDLESAIADKSSLAEQLKAAQQELAELRKQLQTKNDEVAKLEKEKKEIKDKAKAQQKLHAKALETAMQSLVRLCVVAPTVNVHLGEQTLGCKAPLPQKTIRNLVEHQILPNFTSIFLQAEEGAGPGGATLDTWLEGLLAEMQSSIERHLKHVFQNEDKQ